VSPPSPGSKADTDSRSSCKGEFRQCALGNDFDSESDTLIAAWQDACGPYLPSGITTPEVAAATKTLAGGLAGNVCVSLAESCAQRSQSITACSSSHTAAADLTSCRCQPSLVTLASGCDIDFRETCLQETVTRSNIFEFRVCEATATTDRLPASTVRITSHQVCDETDSGAGCRSNHGCLKSLDSCLHVCLQY
jgi:hypothetical protein